MFHFDPNWAKSPNMVTMYKSTLANGIKLKIGRNVTYTMTEVMLNFEINPKIMAKLLRISRKKNLTLETGSG